MNILLSLIMGLNSMALITPGLPKMDEFTENSYSAYETVEPNGLYTSITLFISCEGDGKVSAGAKNTFTLFPSVVRVYVELYYSNEYERDFSKMTLAAREYIEDLDMGKTLTATASTDGEMRYWKPRTLFKKDNNEWNDKSLDAILVDGNGNQVK